MLGGETLRAWPLIRGSLSQESQESQEYTALTGWCACIQLTLDTLETVKEALNDGGLRALQGVARG